MKKTFSVLLCAAIVITMTVSTFAGYDALMSAYDMAKKEKYRFGTYGDAMLIL